MEILKQNQSITEKSSPTNMSLSDQVLTQIFSDDLLGMPLVQEGTLSHSLHCERRICQPFSIYEQGDDLFLISVILREMEFEELSVI